MLQAQGIVPVEKIVPKTACRRRLNADEGGPTKRARTDENRNCGVGSEHGKEGVKSEGVDEDLRVLLVCYCIIAADSVSLHLLNRHNARLWMPGLKLHLNQ